MNGYLHALKYHRTVNLIDYVLRSAHLKSVLLQRREAEAEAEAEGGSTSGKGGAGTGKGKQPEVAAAVPIPIPEYTYTAQYLNHQTKEQGEAIKRTNLPGSFRAVIGLHHGGQLEPHSLDHMQTGRQKG